MSARGPVRWIDRLSIRPPTADESVGWEIEHHLQEMTDRLIQLGWAPDAARLEAERRFGLERYGPALRRMERGRMTVQKGHHLWDFARESVSRVWRGVRRDRAFTFAVVVTLALGIGANATMYGIVDRLLLQPPNHIEDPDALQRVFVQRPFIDRITTTASITVPDAADLETAGGFSGVATYSYRGARTMGAGPDAVSLQVVLATHDFFPLLGVRPALGRFYLAQEDRPEAEPVAVISHELWNRHFASDPNVLGRTIDLSGAAYTVVGVTPAGFTGIDLAPVDLWLPLHRAGDPGCIESRGCYWISAVARLANGASIAAAEAEATGLHVNGRRPDIDRGNYSAETRVLLGHVIAARGLSSTRAASSSSASGATAEARVATWLTGVSLIVLLIACANVANLLLARSTRRRREVAVRLALGVSRRQLVAHMVVETVLLAGAGGALALGIARWGGDFVRGALLPDVLFADAAVNARVLAFTALATLLAGLLAALGPAIQATRGNLLGTLAEARPGVSSRRSRSRTFLTVAQAAMSVVLLVGAGLFVRSLDELRDLDLGLDVERLVLARLELVDESASAVERNNLYREAAERAASLPFVEATAIVDVPFMWASAGGLRIPGRDSIPSLPGGGPYRYAVSPGYFEALGIEIVRGRPLTESDVQGAPLVAVISETMARALWPQGDALGACMRVGANVEECTTVVGVAEDAARSGYQDEPFMAYYLAFAQRDLAAQGLYVRTRGRTAEAIAGLGPAWRALAAVRYADVQSMREVLQPEARSWTLGAAMFTVFGLLALVVAAIGLYSVLAFDVAQRTRELGIRTALGAAKGRLLQEVVWDGARLAGAGVVFGLLAAWLAAPLAQDLLFQVSPREPVVMGAVASVLLAVALAASLGPGVRATRVDPMVSLRSE